jgi:glyoxylase-like metal-dependent hydrolase (beta-lactamase superfamily II)
MPRVARAAWARQSYGTVVAHEPFGNLERVADNTWALVSTPLGGDSTTVSNGGIVAGRNAVLAIEGLNKPEGATWLATKARELTGRWPTHVVLTHYHSDHANGVTGYFASGAHPPVRSTMRTRDLVIERNKPVDDSRSAALRDAILMSSTEATSLDLGGRTVKIVPRLGHTDSDVSLELDEQNLVFCGDLFWNAMFPNFVDAIPTKLASSVRALRRTKDTIYVPGHGAVGKAVDYDRYIAMLDEVERGARKAYSSGASAADAGGNFSLPASLGEWAMFNKIFYARAFEAWYKELKPS